jgi:hypothetical protein
MELSCDTSIKIKFEALPLHDSWIYIRDKCVELSQLTVNVLLLFGTNTRVKKCFQQWRQLNQSTVTAISFKVSYESLYGRSTLG